MRAVILGTDFVKDVDDSFKTLETNTDIQIEFDINSFFNMNELVNFVKTNSFNEIHIIKKYQNFNQNTFFDVEQNLPSNEVLPSFVPTTITGSTTNSISLFSKILKKSFNDLNYICTIEEHELDINSITIPYIEDADNKLIIRFAYDTTALIDDEYAKDNWSYLKLMNDIDSNSIPKTYINDSSLGFDSIGTTIRDNGIHPNYIVKKRYTPSDNTIYPIIHKINSIEELNNLKTSLEIDEYIQEYIYNENDLLENRLQYYRSIDMVYGSNLDTLNLCVFQKTNMLELSDTTDYDDTKIVQKWERPKYLPKVFNKINDTSTRIDADSNSKILLSDDTIKLAGELVVGDIVKSVKISDIQGLTESEFSKFSSSFETILQDSTFTTASVTDINSYEYYGQIINIELNNGAKFSDVPHAKIFIEKDNLMKLEEYSFIENGNKVLVINRETNQLEEAIVTNIYYTLENLISYRITLDSPHIFETLDESTLSKYGLITHNYSYDCILWQCTYSGYYLDSAQECGSGNVHLWQQGYWMTGCFRNNYPYYRPGCYSPGDDATVGANNIGYCNGSKSDKRLKKNIEFLYEQPNGLKIYQYEFRDEIILRQPELKGKWQGVIAQDLINTKFENSLTLEDDGFFMVNYDKLGFKQTKIK
jgi:hypothetical protein